MGLCYGRERILKVGRVTDFQAHQLEHQLGAYTDCNHGQGLAVIHPAYYRHVVEDAEEKFEKFAKEVFGADTARAAQSVLKDRLQEIVDWMDVSRRSDYR